ncbi:MAG: hypothetical protein LUM44_19480 [Pyrinomonadaceae bacterium]|nr:hypothetical protein [Pyrinomonadaceae bacterium]
MSKKIVLILILGFISLSIMTVVSANSYRYLFNGKQELFPNDVVRQYIDNSLEGKENEVAQLVTNFPPSYFEPCVKKESDVNEESINKIRFKPKNLKIENNKIDLTDSLSDNFLKYINSNDESTLPFLEARYIFAQKSIITNFNFIKTNVYDNEAIVSVEYNISNKTTSYSDFYLKKDENGWKIFLVLSKNSTEYLKNETYAQEEKGCK